MASINRINTILRENPDSTECRIHIARRTPVWVETKFTRQVRAETRLRAEAEAIQEIAYSVFPQMRSLEYGEIVVIGPPPEVRLKLSVAERL